MNLRPSGYEPDELPGCSTPRHLKLFHRHNKTHCCGSSVNASINSLRPENWIRKVGLLKPYCCCLPDVWVQTNCFRISPRPISIRQLHTLLCFHPEPINLVVFKGSYILGNLILRGASRLDAFSAYPVRTWLPSGAPGGTTGTPAVRPSRSSRTKDSSSQISCARDR